MPQRGKKNVGFLPNKPRKSAAADSSCRQYLRVPAFFAGVDREGGRGYMSLKRPVIGKSLQPEE